MNATVLLNSLRSSGFTITTTDGDLILVKPASKLSDRQKRQIRQNRDDLLSLLREEADPFVPPPPHLTEGLTAEEGSRLVAYQGRQYLMWVPRHSGLDGTVEDTGGSGRRSSQGGRRRSAGDDCSIFDPGTRTVARE